MLLPRQPQEKPGNEATLFVPFYQAVHTGTKTGLCSRSVLYVHSHSSHVPSYIILYFSRWNGMERPTTSSGFSNYHVQSIGFGSPITILALLITIAKSICKIVNTSRGIPN